MIYLISYAMHLIVSVSFFLLLPFPWLIKGSLLEERKKFELLLRIYKQIIAVAHIGVIVTFVTGFLMSTHWLDGWFFLVIVNWLVISMYLGMTAKFVRLILEDEKRGERNDLKISKLKKNSLFLMFSIMAMFIVKLFPYFY